MRVAPWLVAAIALLLVGHWWLPAYPLAAICALLTLAAHDRGPARRRHWHESKRVGR